MRPTLCPKFFAIFPKQIVVFVRIPGCSSFAVRARNFNRSPLIVRSLNLSMTASTALTVCSRTTGATSVNPDVICGKILSFTIFWGRLSIINGKLSNRQTRSARSGLANRRTMTGVSLELNSSEDNLDPILIIAPRTLGPPPPNSTDFNSSGSTFILKNSSGKSSVSPSSSLRQSVLEYFTMHLSAQGT